jgi:hypothetical protein
MSFMPHPLLASGQTATLHFMPGANKEKIVKAEELGV